jgi:2,4-didehydro-3-deoxy-L-rhamnonate hydrolase
MRFIGVEQQGRCHIAELQGDEVFVIAEARDFYADLGRLATGDRNGSGWTARSSFRELPAVWAGARVLCVGLNYKAHAAEGGNALPDYPAIFGRWTRSLVCSGDAVPALDDKLDWEGELGVVVGKELASVTADEAWSGVFGYAAFNDISARTYQRHTHQWTPGKNMDRSGVLGEIVTADKVGDPRNGLLLETRLNGKVMQSALTSDMIFPVGDILAYLSGIMTLYPGDLVVTGTPSGVGYARNPPILMKPGDEIEVSIERVGRVRNPIVEASRRHG